MRITLTLGDKTYAATAADLAEVTIGECRVIKQQTGMTISDWLAGFGEMSRDDPDVYAILVYLLRSRAGEQVNWSELDAIPLSELVDGFDVTDTDDVEPVVQELVSAAAPVDLRPPTHVGT